MIPWWGWILILVSSAVLSFLLFWTLPYMLIPLIKIKEQARRKRYAKEAKQRNERARLKRLEATTWRGYPLPTGKEGTLRITRKMYIDNPNVVSNLQFEQVYFDRARDMHVELEISHEIETGDTLLRWKPIPGRKPRENY